MFLYSAKQRFIAAAIFTVLLIHTYNRKARCEAALTPLNDTKREGYSRLIRDITNHSIYSEKVPPVITAEASKNQSDDTTTMQVRVLVTPIAILGLDGAEQTLKMSSFVTLQWYDEGLRWNPADYGGVTNIEMPSSSFWMPIVTILNGVENNNFLSEQHPVSINYEGQFVLAMPLIIKTYCDFDLTFFPFDTQDCNIMIISTSQSRTHLIAITNIDLGSTVNDIVSGGEWILKNLHMDSVRSFNYRTNVKDIRVSLQLRRRTTFYLVSIVGPMGLFTLMNCLVFTIPPQSGEKVSFLIFISNAIFSSFLSGVMPRGLNKKLPVMMAYQLFMWIWSIVTFMATIVVLRKFNKEQESDSGNTTQPGQRPNHFESAFSKLAVRPWERFIAELRGAVTRNKVSVRNEQAFLSDTNQQSSSEDILQNIEYNNEDLSSKANPQQPETKPALSENPQDHLDRTNSSNNNSGGRSRSGITAEQLDRIFLIVSLLIVAGFNITIVVTVAHSA